MTFGFSYIGLIFVILLIIPNLLCIKHLPKQNNKKKENIILLVCEKLGQALILILPLIFINFNISSFNVWTIWLLFAFITLLLYEVWWMKFFKSNKSIVDLYSSLLYIPVAGATLPVITFLLLGIYGKNIPLIISSIIFGIGHISIHLITKRELTNSTIS